MAVDVVNAGMERAVKIVRRDASRFVLPTFRSLRHGAPAATYNDRARGEATVARDATDRMLYEDWGWA